MTAILIDSESSTIFNLLAPPSKKIKNRENLIQ